MRARATALAVLITLGLVAAPVLPAHAADCDADSATTLPVSAAGRPIAIYGDDIGEESMALLWDFGMKWNTHDFGKAIAVEQNWFGECKYPGIGLGTGSGWSWHDRNVTLWVWADAVDLAQARATILSLVELPPVTITPESIITTTTTVQETTTTTTTTIVVSEPAEAVAAVLIVSEPEIQSQESIITTTSTTTTVPAPVIVATASAVKPSTIVATKAAPKKVVKKKTTTKKKVLVKK